MELEKEHNMYKRMISTTLPILAMLGCEQEPERIIGKTSILVDVSDELSKTQINYVRNIIQNLKLVDEDKLCIYFIQPEGEDPVKEGKCIEYLSEPKRNATSSIRIEKRRYEEYNEGIKNMLHKMDEEHNYDTSPILSALNFIRSEEYSFDLGEGEYRIVIFSDMLQNSSLISHFKSLDGIDKIPAWLSIKLDGINVDVYQLYSIKYNHRQTDEQKEWWEEYFHYRGVNNLTWTYL